MRNENQSLWGSDSQKKKPYAPQRNESGSLGGMPYKRQNTGSNWGGSSGGTPYKPQNTGSNWSGGSGGTPYKRQNAGNSWSGGSGGTPYKPQNPGNSWGGSSGGTSYRPQQPGYTPGGSGARTGSGYSSGYPAKKKSKLPLILLLVVLLAVGGAWFLWPDAPAVPDHTAPILGETLPGETGAPIGTTPPVETTPAPAETTPPPAETTVPPTEGETELSGFFYRQMSASDQEIYRIIYEAILDMDEKTGDIYARDLDHLSEIFYAVRDDHSEFFWLENEHTRTTYSDGEYYTITPKYRCTKEERGDWQKVIDKAVEPVLQSLQGKSDYEKVKGVHDFLVNQTIYDLDYTGTSIYEMFRDQRAVCEGYARATDYMLDKLGVETLYVSGDAGGAHAWNIVKVDGEYYQLDVTWDDPVSDDGTQTLRYFYFLITSEELFRNHTQEDRGYPVCTATAANYYVREGLFLERYDEDFLTKLYTQALEADGVMEFRCGSKAVFEETLEKLFDDDRFWDIAHSVQAQTGHAVENVLYSSDDTKYVIKITFTIK